MRLPWADHTPPGLHARIMGLQNIKGTGLDFVYRWQAWEQCHSACVQLQAEDASSAAQGLAELVRFHDYGLLCEVRLRAALDQAAQAMWSQREDLQSDIETVRLRLDSALETVRQHMSSQSQEGWRARVLQTLEAFLDAGDAVRRRKRAERLYRDLVSERISTERAALELQALTKRQKGGWLQSALQARL